MRAALWSWLLIGSAVVAQQPRDLDVDATVRKLIDALAVDDHQVRVRVRHTLTRFGAHAVPQLLDALLSASATHATPIHENVVRVLGRIGEPAADGAVPVLVALLPHDLPAFETVAVHALGELVPFAPSHAGDVREVMLSVLDADPVAAAAGSPQIARFFIPISPSQPGAIRTWSRTFLAHDTPTRRVVEALCDPNPYVREHAIELLADRADRSDAVIDGLCSVLTATHPDRVIVEETGGTALIEFPIDLHRRLRHDAACALLEVAPDDPRAVPGHVLLLERPGPGVRRRVATALGRIGAPAEKAVPVLLRILESDVIEVRRDVVTALGMIGSDTRAVRAALEAARESDDAQLARRAAAAVRRLDRQ